MISQPIQILQLANIIISLLHQNILKLQKKILTGLAILFIIMKLMEYGRLLILYYLRPKTAMEILFWMRTEILLRRSVIIELRNLNGLWLNWIIPRKMMYIL